MQGAKDRDGLVDGHVCVLAVVAQAEDVFVYDSRRDTKGITKCAADRATSDNEISALREASRDMSGPSQTR